MKSVTNRRLAKKDAGDGGDWYPTPACVPHALILHEPFKGEIEEPACGDGSMSRVLETTGNRVISKDLYDRGYGESGHDFIQSTGTVANIVTNPPFNKAEEFIHVALRRATDKVAFLLRLCFLSSARRYRSIYSVCPPSRVWIFTERCTMYPGETKDQKQTGSTDYAWFVWDKSEPIGKTELHWIPVGYRSRFDNSGIESPF